MSRTNQNLRKFLRKYNIRHEGNLFDTIHEPLVVSDDTGDFELRPNKRITDDSRNSSSLNINVPNKKNCSHPTPINDNDSVEVGPSHSN
ncbi:unnamed protein product [Rhizophagus irregularis]|nr:unnamed protein product [Rhizophagus irregularis]